MAKVFRRLAGWYLSIDKGGSWNPHPIAMNQMDLTDLDLADNSVDFVQCSHVLENIIDDHRAISEIYRVLAPGGMAALQVQIYGPTTTRVEEPNAEDYFHVWHPGIDYFQRYKDAGFDVRIFDSTIADTELLAIYGKLLVPICVKPGYSSTRKNKFIKINNVGKNQHEHKNAFFLHSFGIHAPNN